MAKNKRAVPIINANTGLGRDLSEEERATMIRDATVAVSTLFKALKIPMDYNTGKTPHRVAKMLIDEQFSGLYSAPPSITLFPNDKGYDQLITVGPITVKSTCAHHLLPFTGSAWIGVLPGVGKGSMLMGLSKYSRIVNYFARRPQMQEELTKMIGEYIYETIKPAGLGVLIECTHDCACLRGVQEKDMWMTTTSLYGSMKTHGSLKSEFLMSIKNRKGV
jgi:GTP cyclohydrolase I